MSSTRSPRWWRQLILLAMFLGFSVLVVTQFTDARRFVQTLDSGSWYWILASIFLFASSFYLYAMLYRIGFQAVELEVPTTSMVPPLMASIFLNTFAPVGEAIFVQDAVEHGRSGARTAPGVLLVLAVDLGTSLPFIAVGMVFLRAKKALPFYDVVASALFLLVVLLFVGALWLGNVRKNWLTALLAWTERVTNRVGRLFRRPDLIARSWVEKSADQFSEASSGIARHPDVLAASVVLGLVMHVVNAAGLYTLFLAFHYPVGIGMISAGFGMSIVLYVIAVTPHGVGAAEGVMSLLFSSTGVPGAIAVVVALGYRIFNVWIPVVIGYLFTRRMRIFAGIRESSEDPADRAV